MAKFDRAVNTEYVEKLKHLDAPTSWVLFGYEGRDKIVPVGHGEQPIDGRTDEIDGSGLDEFCSHLKDDEVQFGLLKMIMGDRESKRPKFVLVSWIGPNVGVMKKAKVSIHKASVKDFMGQIHCELTADDKDLLAFEEVRKRVKSAMGADYDMGSNSREAGGQGKAASYKSQQSEIKAKAKAAYQEKEKGTTIGAVVFDKGPLQKGLTPCDISGRPTVASNSEAKKNTDKVMADAHLTETEKSPAPAPPPAPAPAPAPAPPPAEPEPAPAPPPAEPEPAPAPPPAEPEPAPAPPPAEPEPAAAEPEPAAAEPEPAAPAADDDDDDEPVE